MNWFSGDSEDILVREFVSYLHERSMVFEGAEPDNQADDVLSGLPRWQGTGMGSYTNGPFTLFVQGRYIGGGLATPMKWKVRHQ